MTSYRAFVAGCAAYDSLNLSLLQYLFIYFIYFQIRHTCDWASVTHYITLHYIANNVCENYGWHEYSKDLDESDYFLKQHIVRLSRISTNGFYQNVMIFNIWKCAQFYAKCCKMRYRLGLGFGSSPRTQVPWGLALAQVPGEPTLLPALGWIRL